jgi:hypothetical protein
MDAPRRVQGLLRLLNGVVSARVDQSILRAA